MNPPGEAPAREFCQRCGVQLGPDWKFCGRCGRRSEAHQPTAIVLDVAKIEPVEQLAWFRRRLPVTHDVFSHLSQPHRAVAFTVFGLKELGQVKAIHKILEFAIRGGWGRERFVIEANARLKGLGVAPLKPRRLRTVYTNNVHAAYNAVRIADMLSTAVRTALPWWQYRTVGDGGVREAHAALHNFIARWDDPVWRIIFPPNGHECRCGVFAISEERARGFAADGGFNLEIPGLERLPARPAPGFDHWPAIELNRRELRWVHRDIETIQASSAR